ARSSVPILAISATRTSVDDRVRALRIGADDYLPKPFEPAELLARVEALARRARATPRLDGAATLRADGIALDLLQQTVRVHNGPPVALTPTECRLLARLVQSPGQVVSRRALREALWGSGAVETADSLASYVAAL